MATKIVRKTASIFCGGLSAGSQQVTQFASKVQSGTPNYTVDPATIQDGAGGTWWGAGWNEALVATNNSEYKQDRNAVDLVFSYQIAYLLQQGIAEYDAATPYFISSIVQYGGAFYLSLIDNNTGNQPDTHPSDWRKTSAQPTTTVLASGSGTYTPPAGCVMIAVRMVGGGGGATGAGVNTTFGAFTAGGGGAYAGSASPTIGGAGGSASGGSVNIVGASGGTDGGSSPFGGAGTSGSSAAANSGSGAGGGGSGGYVEGSVASAGATSYAVGAGGTGTQAGGSGIIIIEEFYY